MKNSIIKATLISMLICIMSACSSKVDDPDTFGEPIKDLSGSWMLKSVIRNGTDISEAMDFSKFHLNLKKDNTYTLENYLPFIVKKNGQWRADDPLYPFHLILKEDGVIGEVSSEIKFPISNGKRQVSLMLSPGCSSNKYVYVFEKVTE